MGMEYKKIHACPNDCILYRKEFELSENCLRCGLSLYKLKQKYDDNIKEMAKHVCIFLYKMSGGAAT